MRRPLTFSPIEIIVIFQPARTWAGCPWWWRLFTRLCHPDIGHVLALFWDPDGGAWWIMDPVFGGLQCRAVADPARTLTGQILRDYPGTALAIVPTPRSGFTPVARGPVECVTAVKALLGRSNDWSVTPWQLFKRLRAEGYTTWCAADGQASSSSIGAATAVRQQPQP